MASPKRDNEVSAPVDMRVTNIYGTLPAAPVYPALPFPGVREEPGRCQAQSSSLGIHRGIPAGRRTLSRRSGKTPIGHFAETR